MEDSVDENWSKVIGEESPERYENERIVDPFSAEAPYKGQHFDTVEDARLWYERYGRGQGFSTKIRNSTKRPRLDDIVLKLDEFESYLQNNDSALTQIDASQQNISTSVADSLVSGSMILNPFVVQTKGRAKINHNKKGNMEGGMEEVVMKKKRTCKSCRVLGNHDKRTCPLLKTMIVESRDNNNGESIQPLHSNSDNHNI
ncbi:hypothetical protein GIB67_022241 [Kingdonia uniflora]|uniref:Uncharacterized protein n=1 Tax=Kingdonia uniflora TaxID=39325 RepID=A0A7J7M6X3_9MAGN|nr:hypothetical protein GIB67_022241 [Kingdonia uniflora]